MKRISFLLYLGAAALLVAVIYSTYAFWQRSVATDKVAILDKSIIEYQAKIAEKESNNITQAVNAKQTVNDLKKGTIEWSKVISQIRATVPKNGVNSLVDILSYSGSSSNEISMNMKTFEGSENPYLDVAAAIKSFTDSELFADAFVPSISSGKDVLSFTMSAKYIPPKDELELPKADLPASADLKDSLSTVLDNGLEEKTVAPVDQPLAPVAR